MGGWSRCGYGLGGGRHWLCVRPFLGRGPNLVAVFGCVRDDVAYVKEIGQTRV